MKIKNLLLGMMTCATLAACSSNELLDNNVDGNKIKGDAYVAVNIVSTNSPNSKALGNTENGTDEENKVNNAIFFFFDAHGNGCADPATPPLDFKNEQGDANTLSKAVLVLEKATTIPTSIVAVMNPTDEIKALGAGTNLEALRTTVAEATEAGNFIMSNSAYANDNNALVDATPIGASNIHTSSDKALANPVTIHVERVVAKVEATLKDAKISKEEFTINNEKTKIKVKLLGWKATALNPESNLIKAIDPIWPMAWWNDATNFRSFWGASKETTTYTYFSHTDIADNDKAEYCLENTSATTTKLIVAAELQTEDGEPIDLMEWKGVKNTKDDMKISLANTKEVQKYYTTEDSKTYTQLTADLIDFTTVGTSDETRYTVIATLKSGAPTLYTITNGIATEATPEKVNETLKKLGEIKYWNGGASYFYVDIEHHGGETDDIGKYGIIRNHSYKLNVTAVSGLGTPVPTPSDKIIPEKPVTDESSYLAATVQVLKWKIVNQEVSLSDK